MVGQDIREIEIGEIWGVTKREETLILSTFLLHLVEKGYLSTSKKGWSVYYHALIQQDVYLQEQTKGFLDFWYDGNLGNLVSFLSGNDLLNQDDLERLKRCLDEMDF